MVKEETIDPMDVEAEDFEGIEYHNDDVDTDRGVWEQRSFEILFKTHNIILSEKDFSDLVEAMKQYVDHARAEEKFMKEMEDDHKNKGGKNK